MITVKRALISVSDKTGIVDLARELVSRGVEIISTGGTASLLRTQGVAVTPVDKVTGFPEIMDGRVKTLTPQIHGGLLARRDREDHLRQIRDLGIGTIDLVVVNLYPFESTVARPGATFEEAVENIDIGGPSMLRSAAKNFPGVCVVTDPADYPAVLGALADNQGRIPEDLSYRLARKIFRETSRYDGLIASYLAAHRPDGSAEPGGRFPEVLPLTLVRRQELRYGENPHQGAALYEAPGWMPAGLVQADIVQGKPLSYNNFLDLDSAWGIVADFAEPAVTIVKHTNPCCAAVGTTPEEAYRKALETDPVSAYGGIVGCNRPVTGAMAAAMAGLFLEAVAAPGYEEEALAILAKKPNLRLLRIPPPDTSLSARMPDLRSVAGGILVQDRDRADDLGRDGLKVVTRREPNDKELQAMLFAWKLVRHLKSNAVAFTSPDRLLSMGCGQTSRVECVRLAQAKSRLSLAGSALASDAFFPFRDGLDRAAEAGATAVIQPGGSIRDGEVIAAADERGVTMVFTGIRHFRH